MSYPQIGTVFTYKSIVSVAYWGILFFKKKINVENLYKLVAAPDGSVVDALPLTVQVPAAPAPSLS